MKVKCVRLQETNDGKRLGHLLTIGREYDVLEIHFEPSQGVLLRFIGDDRFTAALFSGELFEITSQEIPHTWVVAKNKLGGYTLGPRPWLAPGFWERYFDREPEAVRTFEEERYLMRRSP